jgi:hypothetical protein
MRAARVNDLPLWYSQVGCHVRLIAGMCCTGFHARSGRAVPAHGGCVVLCGRLPIVLNRHRLSVRD